MDILNTKIKDILAEKVLKIKPENIKKDVTVFDVTGSYEGLDTSDATAAAGDIKTDKTAYVNGQKIIGTFAGIIPTGTLPITQNGTVDVSDYASANVNVSGGGGGKNYQYNLSHVMKAGNVIGKTGLKLTVSKTGTYTVHYHARKQDGSTASGTFLTALYINGTRLQSTVNSNWTSPTLKDLAEWSSNTEQINAFTGISLSENDEIEVYVETKGNSYYIHVYDLFIEEE